MQLRSVTSVAHPASMGVLGHVGGPSPSEPVPLSRQAMPSNPLHDRAQSQVLKGINTTVPTYTVVLDDDSDSVLEQAMDNLRKRSGADNWNLQVTRSEGHWRIEILHCVQLGFVLKQFLEGKSRAGGELIEDIARVDSRFAAVANPVCQAFEAIWMEHMSGRSRGPAVFAGSRTYLPQASRKEYAGFVQELFASDSLCIGEIHCDLTPKAFVRENMAMLSQCGFSTLYLEGIPTLASDMLQAYFDAPDNTPLPPALDLLPYSELLAPAKACGLRVVGLDSDFALNSHLGEPQGQISLRSRIAAFNCHATRVIEDDAPLRRGGKYLVLQGASHSDYVDDDGWVPGLPDALGIASVFIADVRASDLGDNDDASNDSEFSLITGDCTSLIPADSPPWLRQIAARRADAFISAWFCARMEGKETPTPLTRRRK